LKLNIDKEGKEPVYQQIHHQIKSLVLDGLLEAGTKIPSVRQLAKDLGVSVTTVHYAYEALAAENIIETRHGSGTYITAHPGVIAGTNLRTREEMDTDLGDLPPMRWEPYGFKSDFFRIPPSKKHSEEGLIKFSVATPDPHLFPFDRIKQVATNLLWYPKEFFFEYGHAQGYLPLVDFLEKEMALSGVPMAEGENDIIITAGFQRALSLILRLVLKQGQKVAIEAPTYTRILNLLLAEKIDFEPIPIDGEGMDTDYLASVLGRGEVKAIITIPTYHNPTGVTMSQPRREHLLRLAAKHRIPIIEDDWGRALRYDGEAIPPLKAMDKGGYVIHVGTFSKCFLPGLRIGWITAPADFSLTLVRAKLGADVGDSYFLQTLLHEFILKGHFSRHQRKTLKEYKRRRNTMVKALNQHLPDGCSFNTPKGGFTIWVQLPGGLRSLPLLTLAREAGVEFLPAAFCMPDRKDAPAFRLSFSRTSVDDIEKGIKILGDVIKRCINNPDLLYTGAQSYEDLFQ
jgi:DNA-binding transcriptional MocR family regulator